MIRVYVILAVGCLVLRVAPSSGLAETGADPVPIGPPSGPDLGARQPQVAVDDGGRIYVAYGRGNEVHCAVSRDGGRTFAVGTVGAPPTLALGMRRGPRVAATEASVIVTAIGGERGGGKDGDLLAWRSTDEGRSWAGPTRINSEEGSAREGLHGMASAADGSVFCAWLDLRHGRTEVYGALSVDGGTTWESDALVYRAPDKSVCECCHPSVAFAPDGTLFVMWRNQVKGARDLYLSRSRDRGKTFEPAEKLGEGTWKLNACPMDGGAVAVGPEGRVETIWMRSGVEFSATPGDAEKEIGPGVQGWVAVGEDGPYRLWLGARDGPLFALTPGDPEPRILAREAHAPVVAAGPKGRGPVVAAWESGGAGGGLMMLRLDRPPSEK